MLRPYIVIVAVIVVAAAIIGTMAVVNIVGSIALR